MSQITRDMIQITRCNHQFRDEFLAPMGLKSFHASYLVTLYREPGISQDKLAKAILVDKSNVARQIAALEMGLDEVPCIRLDHMTDEQRRDYAIRHNRTAELSAWDFGKLEEELADLDIAGFDMMDFGFSDTADFSSSSAPENFKEFSEETETKNRCPRCGYEWN